MSAVPPTVSETKRKFLELYRKPVPGIVNPQLQEFIVEQHFNVYNTNYVYTEIAALGLVSLFRQVVTPELGVDPEALFTSFITSVGQDPAQYTADADALEAWAKGLEGPEELKGDPQGGRFPKMLAQLKERAEGDKLNTTLFFSIGLFRLLELTGAKDPKMLATLVKEVGAKQVAVNRQLTSYKSVLSKLKAAKELMQEFLQREKRKAAERAAEKQSKAAGDGAAAAKDEQPAEASA